MATAPAHAASWLSLRSPTTSGWSSIIGIVVAIVGNVLISFALNTQRYAHIRLNREKDAAKAQKRQQGYGTAQGQDEGQTRKGITQSHSQNGKHSGQNDSQPLLGRTNSDASKASVSSSEDEQSGRKNYLASPWWWLGITLMIIGECGNFLAYGFAPASIVSPLGVVALISNCLIAPWMLHEKFRKRDALGVLIATGGCVIVVLSASGSNPRLDADEIWRLISTWEFKTYFGITMGLIVVLMWASSRYGDKSILIDIGLVGLFGKQTRLSCRLIANREQAGTLLYPPRVSPLYCQTPYGESLHSLLRIFLWLYSSSLRSCRSNTSTGHYSDSIPLKSYPRNSSCSRFRLLWVAPFCTETLSGNQRRTRASSLPAVH